MQINGFTLDLIDLRKQAARALEEIALESLFESTNKRSAFERRAQNKGVSVAQLIRHEGEMIPEFCTEFALYEKRMRALNEARLAVWKEPTNERAYRGEIALNLNGDRINRTIFENNQVHKHDVDHRRDVDHQRDVEKSEPPITIYLTAGLSDINTYYQECQVSEPLGTY